MRYACMKPVRALTPVSKRPLGVSRGSWRLEGVLRRQQDAPMVDATLRHGAEGHLSRAQTHVHRSKA